MPHLVMDSVLVAHEVEFSIPDAAIKARLPEWQKLTVGCKSRSDYVKGVLEFWGLDLLEYDTAMIHRNIRTGIYTVIVLSRWARERREKEGRPAVPA